MGKFEEIIQIGKVSEAKKSLAESKEERVELIKNEEELIRQGSKENNEGFSESIHSPSSDETIKSNIERLKKKMMETNPEEREAELGEQKRFIESSGSTELNRMLAYAKFQDAVLLHVSPSKTLQLSEKLRFLNDGLNKLADVLVNDPKIKKVQGSSWIMQENPRLVERLGFRIEEIPKMEKAIHFLVNLFRKEKSPQYKSASMSREDFLKRYLKA